MDKRLVYNINDFLSVEIPKNITNNDMKSYHTHLSYELYFLLSGTRTLHIKDTIFPISSRTACIIPPNTSHRFVNTGRGDYSAIIFYFNEKLFNNEFFLHLDFNQIINQNLIIADLSLSPTTRGLESLIINELSLKPSMYKANIMGSFFQLITYMSREKHKKEISPHFALENSDIVTLVMQYINKHIESDLSLDKLANSFFISPSYLSRKFKRETQKNISQYITEERIHRSTWLIKTFPTLSISVVAKRSGFNSLTTFNREFKKIMNCSPTTYKKQNIED